jgi:hypothetical protein
VNNPEPRVLNADALETLLAEAWLDGWVKREKQGDEPDSTVNPYEVHPVLKMKGEL